MSREMLDHAESVFNDFCDDPVDPDFLDLQLDPYTTEEKIIMAGETNRGLEPHQIGLLVRKAMNKLPPLANAEDLDEAFDVLYEVISEAVNS